MSGGSFTIMSSNFSKNTAVWGGITYIINGLLTVSSSVFNNTAMLGGGVMYTLNGSLTIATSDFTACSDRMTILQP